MTFSERCAVLVDEDQAPLDPCRRRKTNDSSSRHRRGSRRLQQWQYEHFENHRHTSESKINMTVDRLLDIYALMDRLEHANSDGVALCAVAAEFMALDGAAIALISDNEDLMSLCTSNHAASALMDLEISLGEGPAVDASRGDATEDTDLAASGSTWSTYRPEAVALGARAVFGYPIRLGAIRFGALSLFRNRPGPLDAGQASDAYLMASVISRAILAEQAGGSQGGLVGELNGASMLDFRVHQAAGMLAIQGSMSVRDALVFLRAHAFAIGSQLSDLAQRVVSGTTRLTPDSREWIDDAAGGNGER
jgi:hypothetical protein